jgi:hypothetical protein
VGVNLGAVLALGADDVWLAGESGALLHFDGGSWAAEDLAPDFSASSFCVQQGELFLGGSGGLLRRTDAGWLSLNSRDVWQLSCTDTAVRYVHGGGAGSWSRGGGDRALFSASGPEICEAMISHPDGGCSVVCKDMGTSSAFAHARTCDGTLEFTFKDGGGSPVVSKMWVDPARGAMVGLGAGPSELYQLSGGAWSLAWNGTVGQDIYAGAPYQGGSLAVGQYGLSLVVDDAGGVADTVPTENAAYLYDVSVAPEGTAWAAGANGEIFSRAPGGGGWQLRSSGNESAPLFGLAFGTTISAVGRGLVTLVRDDAGWPNVEPFVDLTAFVAAWEGPDGLVRLEKPETGRPRLHLPGLQPVELDGVDPRLFVVDAAWALVSTSTGVWQVDLTNGTTTNVLPGVITGLTGDRATRTVFAAKADGIWSSTGGEWTPVAGAPSAPVQLEAGFGDLFALTSDRVLHHFDGQRWRSRLLTTPVITTLVPVGTFGGREHAVLVFGDASAGLQLDVVYPVSNGLLLDSLVAPPVLVYQGQRYRDEIWVVGLYGSVLRFPVPR